MLPHRLAQKLLPLVRNKSVLCALERPHFCLKADFYGGDAVCEMPALRS